MTMNYVSFSKRKTQFESFKKNKLYKEFIVRSFNNIV